jgi:hypothetical protein
MTASQIVANPPNRVNSEDFESPSRRRVNGALFLLWACGGWWYARRSTEFCCVAFRSPEAREEYMESASLRAPEADEWYDSTDRRVPSGGW